MVPHSWGFEITHNDAPQSVGLLWTSNQFVTETSTWQHSQQTNINAPGGIRTHNPSRRVAVDLRLRPRSHWDRPLDIVKRCFFTSIKPVNSLQNSKNTNQASINSPKPNSRTDLSHHIHRETNRSVKVLVYWILTPEIYGDDNHVIRNKRQAYCQPLSSSCFLQTRIIQF